MLNVVPAHQLFPIDLSVAGSQEIDAEGDQLHFVIALDTATKLIVQPAAVLTVQAGGSTAPVVPLSLNAKIKARVSRWIVAWTAQAGVTAYLAISTAGAYDLNEPPTAQLLGGTLNLSKSQTIVDATLSVNAGTRATAVSANSARRTVLISNPRSNSGSFWAGTTATVNVNQGVEVPPGASVALDTAAAVGVWNAGVGTQSVGIVELRD